MARLSRLLAPARRRDRSSGLRPPRGSLGTVLRRRPLPRAALEADRALPRRAHQGGDRRSRPPRPLLHRRRQRRRLEDDRLRPDLAADLRRPADRLDRRDRRGSHEPRRHLRRQRRGHAAARPLDRATGSTARPTAGGPGRTWAFGTASRSRRSSWTRGTRSGSSSPSSATRTVRTRSGGSTARPTGARASRRSSTSTRTRAGPTWPSIPGTRTRCTRCSGNPARARGRTASSPGRAAASSSRRTAGAAGGRSRPACPPSPRAWVGSGSRLRRATRGGSTPRSRPGRRPASTAPTTPARPGRASTRTRA